ncbi:pentatricopeptide repeat-containing protein At2g17033 [Impatiens glandulifera]|uniref:pentatricopeptide repeat-containing protein At2g17033 n=1 Tax=Impatiens glandulifera TaxID=253017 RepID=UPI001FB0622C|nr:pentatricopeptide repeat-containing protein At2g17033 [Impatiens glandulifera]
MADCIALSITLPAKLRRYAPSKPPSSLTICCVLNKRVDTFLSSLITTAAVANDPSVSDRVIRKFVQSSSKSIALDAFSRIISPENAHPHLSSFALTFYWRITETEWFNWNPKLLADLISSLNERGELNEAQSLLSEAIVRLKDRERDLALFYCNLVESHSKRRSQLGFCNSCDLLKQLSDSSSSNFVKRRAFESMIGGYCMMDLPLEAENLISEMKGLMIRPSLFEFRSLIYAYGRLGLFEDMRRITSQMESQGFKLETVCANMMLSSLGNHGEFIEMTTLLQTMKKSGVSFSIRTYNSVLNSCTSISSMIEDLKTAPISIHELMQALEDNNNKERVLIHELIDSSVLEDSMEWNNQEIKLDLHGMHLPSAYLILLQWIEKLRTRLHDEDQVIPMEITVVCGIGKHSIVRGESTVKNLVKQMMIRMDFPMRIDRNNIGCFVGKGKAITKWLNS